MEAADYSIKWQVKSVQIPLGKTMVPVLVTECHIHKEVWAESGFTLLAEYGSAFCGPKDTFQKDKGRKISLARALKKTQLNKKERKEIWEAYRNMTPAKRW